MSSKYGYGDQRNWGVVTGDILLYLFDQPGIKLTHPNDLKARERMLHVFTNFVSDLYLFGAFKIEEDTMGPIISYSGSLEKEIDYYENDSMKIPQGIRFWEHHLDPQ